MKRDCFLCCLRDIVQSVFADNSDRIVVPSKLLFYFWKVSFFDWLLSDVEVSRTS